MGCVLLYFLLWVPLVQLSPLPQGFLVGNRDGATINLLLPPNTTHPWEIRSRRTYTPPKEPSRSTNGLSTIAACILPNTTFILGSAKHWICGTSGGAFPKPLGCILKYNFFNQSNVSVLIPNGRGGLTNPTGITTRNGIIYVIDTNLPAILTFNSTTGDFINLLTDLPYSLPQQYHLRWGPDGGLYCNGDNSVLRIDPITQQVTVFTQGQGPLNVVRGIVWNNDTLFVASRDYGAVLIYNRTGGFIKELIPRSTTGSGISPQGLEIGESGNLYVLDGNTIKIFDSVTGQPLLHPIINLPQNEFRAPRTLLLVNRSDLLNPPCEDGYMNDEESDVDCGGGTCKDRCQHMQGCRFNTDCEVNVECVGGVCVDRKAPATTAWPLILDEQSGNFALYNSEGRRIREYVAPVGATVLDVVVEGANVWALVKGGSGGKGCGMSGMACLVRYNYFSTAAGLMIPLDGEAIKVALGEQGDLLALNKNGSITVVDTHSNNNLSFRPGRSGNFTLIAGGQTGAYTIASADMVSVISASGVWTNYSTNTTKSLCMATDTDAYYIGMNGSQVGLFRVSGGVTTPVTQDWSTLPCIPTLVACPTSNLILVGCDATVGIITGNATKAITLVGTPGLRPIAMSGPGLSQYTLAPCMDGIKDDLETDVDCGGDNCTQCGVNEGCKVEEDCSMGLECGVKHNKCEVPKPPPPPPASMAFVVSEREGLAHLVNVKGEVLRAFGSTLYQNRGALGALEWGQGSLLVAASGAACDDVELNATAGGIGCILKYDFFNSTNVSVFIRGEGGLTAPKDMVFDMDQGVLYVLEPSRILHFNVSGLFHRVVADLPDYGLRSHIAQLNSTTLVVPSRNKVLQVDINTGNVSDLATDGQLNIVMGVYVDKGTGILYAASRDYGAVSKYEAETGKFLGFGAERGSSGSPVDVIAMGDKLFVLTSSSVQLFNGSTAEFIRTIATLRSTPRHLALLTKPSFVADPCNDTHMNDDETDVDCGGSRCGGCLVGYMCKEDKDCASIYLCNGTSHRCTRPVPPPTPYHVEFELQVDNTTLKTIPRQKTGIRETVADVGKVTLSYTVITNVTWEDDDDLTTKVPTYGGVFNFSLGTEDNSTATALGRLLRDAQASGTLLQKLRSHPELMGVTVATFTPPRIIAVGSNSNSTPPSPNGGGSSNNSNPGPTSSPDTTISAAQPLFPTGTRFLLLLFVFVVVSIVLLL